MKYHATSWFINAEVTVLPVQTHNVKRSEKTGNFPITMVLERDHKDAQLTGYA